MRYIYCSRCFFEKAGIAEISLRLKNESFFAKDSAFGYKLIMLSAMSEPSKSYPLAK